MTKQEFTLSGYENKHSKITLKNGEEMTGIISSFFEGHNKYQLVKSSDLRQFKEFMDANKLEEMQKLCSEVNFEDIESIELI